ncbi:MAG TPA: PIN domain-containing protein [Syntrophomonadaceae bacterium]|nr:PIN domain-containing protein [Syntrophomonadaceae bacterium]
MFRKINISKSLLVFALIFGFWAISVSKMFVNLNLSYQSLIGLGVAVMFYFGFGWLISLSKKGIKSINWLLDTTAIEILLGGSAGLFVGVLVGVLSSFPLSLISGIGGYLTILVFIAMGYLGLKIGSRRAYDFFKLLPSVQVATPNSSVPDNFKVLDTSAIIDGRIYDVSLSKFIDGKLLVPNFVIEELQHIADSSDTIRRNKGRRGLDLLSKMQKHPDIKIDIIDKDIADEKEVDNKLLRLCKEMAASIITNDYNLNKVADLQGINVLNINELTNAVKVIVYPGETMHINIIKEGKEDGQGVGYLEDGTMVVVEEAYGDIGNDLEVIVTSVFQTAAGRMIFTRKIKGDCNSGIDNILHNMREVEVYG